MKLKLKGLFLIVSAQYLHAQIPNVSIGKIVRLENFNSQFVEKRNIDIWLPEGYSNKKKYAVIYMHDGQMLFDSTISWNKQSWNVQNTCSNLIKSNKIKDCIVVGIWNSGKNRFKDYFPEKILAILRQSEKDSLRNTLQRMGRIADSFVVNSNAYLQFIVRELKPYIDKNYSVFTNKKNTCIMGSSMGGLISLYAICEYPKIFGNAACLSTHWPGIYTLDNNPIPNAIYTYLNLNLPNPKNHKIYFDCGNKTLDSLYPGIQKKIDTLMTNKKFKPKNWITKYFIDQDHSEKSWACRLPIPMEFLLRK